MSKTIAEFKEAKAAAEMQIAKILQTLANEYQCTDIDARVNRYASRTLGGERAPRFTVEIVYEF